MHVKLWGGPADGQLLDVPPTLPGVLRVPHCTHCAHLGHRHVYVLDVQPGRHPYYRYVPPRPGACR
ncbi:hypothetical protein [Actinokineospora globicatena]|uniref:hypothetical protein n=1 Tax=Actinokineospora globicatena TaxID=103729 RepID=UPI0025574475|nr:hypothetical protein [Actinokineospora globicatena]